MSLAFTLTAIDADRIVACAGDHRLTIATRPGPHGRYAAAVFGPTYAEAWSSRTQAEALDEARRTIARRMEDDTR